MAGLNKVMLIGNLGGDPEYRTAGGSEVANIRLAVSEAWKDKNSGERRERTEWVNVVAWGALASRCRAVNLQKGSQVYVEGKMQTRKWEDQSGNTRYTTDIVAGNILALSPKRSESGSTQDSPEYDDEVPF